MPPHTSDAATLALHAVRLRGISTAAQAAGRFGLDGSVVDELLLDFAANGWVRYTDFAGVGGWSLTEAGRRENERVLSSELQAAGAQQVLGDAHARFLPLNARFQHAVTRWQIRPLPGDELAANDHADFRWDDRVLDDLERVVGQATVLCRDLSDVLRRFDGYHTRLQNALRAVLQGQRHLVDGHDVDSLHRVWFELHEDLLATLGCRRGDEPAAM